MSVGEICNRHVTIIGKYDSIYSAARLMRDHNVTNVIVVESCNGINIPVGVVTDHDIVVAIIAEGLQPDTVSIGDIMMDGLLIANEGDDVVATLKRMRHKGIRRIPVIRENHGLIGVLSIDNILDALAEQLNDIDQIIIREQYAKEQLSLRFSN